MRDTNFKAGDKVRIRSWEDMEKEFGLKPNGAIKCKRAFTEDMRKFCGEVFILNSVDGAGRVYFDKTIGWFSFSTDMIEKVEDTPEDWSVKQRPITSVEDCKRIFEAYKYCHKYTCPTCPIYEYEREGGRKGGDCGWVNEQAKEFMKNHENEEAPVPKAPDLPNPPEAEGVEIKTLEDCIEVYKEKRTCEGKSCTDCSLKDALSCEEALQKALYVAIQHSTNAPKTTPAKEATIHTKVEIQTIPGENQCKDCGYRKDTGGGILFCTWFHNTTVPHGYCHNYKPEEKEVKKL